MNTIEAFKNWLVINTGSAVTVKTYLSRMNSFFGSYSEFNQANVDAFLSKLVTDQKQNSTFNAYLDGFDAYNRYSGANVRLPKRKHLHKRKRPYITEEKFGDILNYIVMIFPKHYNIVEAVISFLFYTGVRKEELYNLKKSNFDLEKRTAILKDTKGKKDRFVYYPQRLADQLKRHFADYPNDDIAFHLDDGAIYYWCKKISQELNLVPKLHPHMLRRSFATMLLRKSNNLQTVKNILGHATLEQTAEYAICDDEMTQAVYDKYIK